MLQKLLMKRGLWEVGKTDVLRERFRKHVAGKSLSTVEKAIEYSNEPIPYEELMRRNQRR